MQSEAEAHALRQQQEALAREQAVRRNLELRLRTAEEHVQQLTLEHTKLSLEHSSTSDLRTRVQLLEVCVCVCVYVCVWVGGCLGVGGGWQ